MLIDRADAYEWIRAAGTDPVNDRTQFTPTLPYNYVGGNVVEYNGLKYACLPVKADTMRPVGLVESRMTVDYRHPAEVVYVFETACGAIVEVCTSKDVPFATLTKAISFECGWSDLMPLLDDGCGSVTISFHGSVWEMSIAQFASMYGACADKHVDRNEWQDLVFGTRSAL